MKNNKSLYYFIWSLEHGQWWKSHKVGYTENIKEAGLYTFDEALQIVASANIAENNVPNEAMVPVVIKDSKGKIV
jgi:hypothetical protein